MNDEVKKTELVSEAGFEAVLDRELSRVLEGRASVDECCAANPGFADELKPLLELALSGQAALAVDDPPAAAAALARKKLLAQAHSLGGVRKTGGRFRLRPLALASGLFLLLFAGTALAAGSAEPDSVLYPLKQRMESARTTLAMQDLDQARVEAEHANRRLDELQKMIDEGKGEYTGSLLADYEAHINDASTHAAAAAAVGENTSEVEAFISSVRGRHDEMVKTLGLEDEEGNEGEDSNDESREDSAGGGDSDDMYIPGSGGTPSGDDGEEGNDDYGPGGSDHPGGGGSGGGDSGGGESPGGGDSGDDGGYDGGGGSPTPPDGGNSGQEPDDEASHGDAPKHDEGNDTSSNHDGPTAAGS
ncbi:MAG: hypothetical protein HZB44_05110 [Actinobacteria bacterium]|nr:hypothetical protein [Actinomycetota bacterium]